MTLALWTLLVAVMFPIVCAGISKAGPTRYDNRETVKALKGSGIAVPELKSYAPKLWDYWERNLDPDLFVDRSLAGKVKDKVVVVTGSSSGIGKATAIKLAGAGAKVILVARGEEKLLETKAEIERAGGRAWICAADIADLASCDALVQRVQKEHGGLRHEDHRECEHQALTLGEIAGMDVGGDLRGDARQQRGCAARLDPGIAVGVGAFGGDRVALE